MSQGKELGKKQKKAAASALEPKDNQDEQVGEVAQDEQAGEVKQEEQVGGDEQAQQVVSEQVAEPTKLELVRIVAERAELAKMYGKVCQVMSRGGGEVELRSQQASGAPRRFTLSEADVVEASPGERHTKIVNLQNRDRPFKKDALRLGGRELSPLRKAGGLGQEASRS